jgi:hypothetical protein
MEIEEIRREYVQTRLDISDLIDAVEETVMFTSDGRIAKKQILQFLNNWLDEL